MSRHIALLATALLVASGCVQTPGTSKPTTQATRKPVTAPATDKPAPAPLVTAGIPRLPEGVLTRLVEQTGTASQLTGKVKLISDHGASLVSNNSGNVIANNSGSLISDSGGGVVANNSAGLVSNNSAGLTRGRQLAQANEGVESTLVDATVYVHDARGQALVDATGKPLAAVSDGQGSFTIAGVLPPENLVLRVRLWNGGELAAILPRGEAGAREIAVDTAATLGATYVLNQFVKGDPATFEKLPAAEAARLTRDLAAVRGLIDQTPDYQPGSLVALTDTLRAKAPSVDQTLTDIKALLLGQANLGGGRQATQVPLADPRALAPDGTGFMVSEGTLGRIRRVAADGTITTYVDQLHGEIKANFYGAVDLVRGSDGALYVLSGKTFGVTRVTPDGKVEDLAGTGKPGRDEVGKPATQVAMRPWSLWRDADGTLWIGEESHEGLVPRILAVGADGIVREPAPPAWDQVRVVGLARGGDKALYALITAGAGELWRLAPGAAAWTQVPVKVELDKQSDLAPAPDGGLLISEDNRGRISHYALDGTLKVLSDATKGSPIKRPTDLDPLADGRIRVIDGGSIRVYELATDGTAKAIAGTGPQGGDASGDAISLNGPFSAAYSPAGHLLVSEAGSHSVKRWDGKDLTTFVGGLKGFGGDTGPATEARLDQPAGVAFRGDELLLLDQGNRRLRAVGADGKIRSLVGGNISIGRLTKGESVPAASLAIANGAHLAVGPDQSIYWSSIDDHQIARLAPDGTVHLVAGSIKGSAGDGGRADEAQLNTPVGITFGPDGALYVADAANMRVRRIVNPAGPAPTLEAFSGLDGATAFGKLAEPAGASEKAAEAAYAFPSALVFDKAGNLYVAEFGTLSLPLLAGIAEGVRALPIEFLPKVPARIRKITPAGVVSVVAGPGSKFFGDPEAGDALVLPTSLAIDPQNRLVIVDAGANLIRFLPAGSY